MKDWIPLLQSLVWPVFAGTILLLGRRHIGPLLEVFRQRLAEGASFEAGGVKLGATQRPPGPAAQAAAAAAVAGAPSLAATTTKSDGLPHEIYLVHRSQPTAKFVNGLRSHELTVYVDADTSELMESVERVVYHLHETFTNREREVTDRAHAFGLKLGVWGEFNVWAEVFTKGEKEPLRIERYLNL